MVNVDGRQVYSRQFSSASQPKLSDLLWGLAVTRRLVCIHKPGKLSQWQQYSTVNIVMVIIIISYIGYLFLYPREG